MIKAETEQGRYTITEDPLTGLARSWFVCNKCKLGHHTLIGTEDQTVAEVIVRDTLNEHSVTCG
jgi:hypothetical protein